MLESIAYIGYGFVGKACHKAFEHNSHAIIIDPKYSETQISDLPTLQPQLTFVAINAPTLDDGSVDASIIYDIFRQLAEVKYDGLVVLKSTLPPAIVYDLYIQFAAQGTAGIHGCLKYIYSPEFLREKEWEHDALNPAMIIMAGNYFDCDKLKGFYENNSSIKQYIRFCRTDYKSAALAKYAINSFLASKVVFMNQLQQVFADTHGIDIVDRGDWEEFTEILGMDTRLGKSHMAVPGYGGKYGYGGSCFPKDVKAFIGFDKEERMSILTEVAEANTKIRLQGNIDGTKKNT